MKAISGTNNNSNQALYRLINVLKYTLSWIAIAFICVEASTKCRLFQFSNSTQLKPEVEKGSLSPGDEEKAQDIINALNQRVEQLLNEILNLRCDLHETWSSRERLRISVKDLNEVITINKHKTHSINTKLKAEKRAARLLKERLSLSKGTEELLIKKARTLERENERVMQLSDHKERKFDDLRQGGAKFDEYSANEIGTGKNPGCLFIQNPQQKSDLNVAKVDPQRKNIEAHQQETTHLTAVNAGNDCVFHTSTGRNDATRSEEYQQDVSCTRNGFLSDGVPVHPVFKEDADILDDSESDKHQGGSERHPNLSLTPESPRNRKSFYEYPDPQRSVTDEEISAEKHSTIFAEPIQDVESHADENKEFSLIEQKKGNAKSNNLFTLPKHTSSPPASTVFPFNDLTVFMDIAKASHLDSMDIEMNQVMPVGNPTSSSCFNKNYSVTYDYRQLGVQEKGDVRMFEPLILDDAGFESICDIFPLEDVNMCKENCVVESEVEQDMDYVATSPGEYDMSQSLEFAAQYEIQGPSVFEDSEKYQMLDSNIDQATETGTTPSYKPDLTDIMTARSSSRNDISSNTGQLSRSLRKESDLCEITDTVKVKDVEEYGQNKPKGQSSPIENNIIDGDETDSLDYLFEGGPEDIRDLFPGAFDSTPDKVAPSGTQVAENGITPAQVEKNPNYRCEAEIASAGAETEANILLRRYYKRKPNPLACLRPNVPGWSFARKPKNKTDCAVSEEGTSKNPELGKFSCNSKRDDNMENEKVRENLSNQNTLYKNSGFKKTVLNCVDVLNVTEKIPEMTPQPDKLKRQRSIYEADGNTRVKRPDIYPEHHRNCSPGVEPSWVVSYLNLP